MSRQRQSGSGSQLTKLVEIRNPFRASDLPLVVKLYKMAYHTLRLQGSGNLEIRLPAGDQTLKFNGRNGQFGGIYNFPDDHIFEAPIVGLMEALLDGDDVFVDVGANWGCLALHAASFAGYDGHIHAFEPVPETFSDLSSLVQQAGLEGRVHCHQSALSDRAGEGKMILPDPAQSGWAQISEDTSGFQVDLRRFDEMGIAPPKLIKIDVEGHELEVLKGAEATLRSHKPFVVFESWLDPRDPAATASPWRFLAELDYAFFCPAWHRDPDLVSISNMPPDGNEDFRLRLVPCTLEHRMFGIEHWSYLACHRDRYAELAGVFSDEPGTSLN